MINIGPRGAFEFGAFGEEGNEVEVGPRVFHVNIIAEDETNK